VTEAATRFTRTEEQQQLAVTVRSFLDRYASPARRRTLIAAGSAHDPAAWKVLADQLGLTALPIPERFGGAGFGWAETAIVVQETGRALFGSPYLSTVGLTVAAILASDDEATMARVLPRLAAGEVLGALGVLEADGRWAADSIQTVARPGGSAAGWQLDGTKVFVQDGTLADVFIIAARSGNGISLFEVDARGPGIVISGQRGLDLTREQARVQLTGAPGRPLGAPGGGWAIAERTRNIGAMLLAHEQVGAAERMLELTVEYAGLRKQFGRSIGSFQAIKHRCAQMLVDVESARAAAENAAWTESASPPEFPVAARMALVAAGRALVRVASEAIQVHGGVGFTWEHDAHLYFRRARASEAMFGFARDHLRELGRLVTAAR
jgi:alkylation response protein AidB-like acyl-CoA dehydrogenase